MLMLLGGASCLKAMSQRAKAPASSKSSEMTTGVTKRAVHVIAAEAVIARTAVEEVEHPVQPAKVEDGFGAAVRVTAEFPGKPAVQVPGQEIPDGLLGDAPGAVAGEEYGNLDRWVETGYGVSTAV